VSNTTPTPEQSLAERFGNAEPPFIRYLRHVVREVALLRDEDDPDLMREVRRWRRYAQVAQEHLTDYAARMRAKEPA